MLGDSRVPEDRDKLWTTTQARCGTETVKVLR